MEVKSNAVKSNIALEPGIRPMNQGKLEVVKHEMERVNIDILGISELRWTGMGLEDQIANIHWIIEKAREF